MHNTRQVRRLLLDEHCAPAFFQTPTERVPVVPTCACMVSAHKKWVLTSKGRGSGKVSLPNAEKVSAN
jgi:hypothetical protein